MNRTEQLIDSYMARRGIKSTAELSKRTGFSPQRLCLMRKNPGGIPNRSLLVLADSLKLSDAELGELVRAQEK